MSLTTASRSIAISSARSEPSSLSILVPVFNEERNIAPLCARLLEVLDELGRPFEIIFVNDGSVDGSRAEMMNAAANRAEIKVLDLRRNYGQTTAMMAAIDHATGTILIPIDSDLQNDPADIPVLIEKLEQGHDVVSGWRQDRKMAFLTRSLTSRVANWIISRVSGVHLRDYGCTLKAYRASVLKNVRLYGEMHRFIPIYASWLGARVTEVPVRHHPRVHGESKYGLERVLKVILDIIVVKFLDRHFTKPIYVFGGFGLLALAASVVTIGASAYLRLIDGVPVLTTPLPTIAAMSFLTAMMCILMGLLAEMLVRTYFESQQKPTYLVRQMIGFDAADSGTTAPDGVEVIVTAPAARVRA